MNLFERQYGKSYCTILPALAAFAPMAIDAIGGATGGGSAGGKPSGGAPAPSQMQKQDQETSVDTSIRIDTSVIGAPININIGGAQQADGSLGGGRYLDRGVDAPGIEAPFGTLQSVAESREVQWGAWMAPPGQSGASPVFLIGGVVIVGAIGLALIMRKKHGSR